MPFIGHPGTAEPEAGANGDRDQEPPALVPLPAHGPGPEEPDVAPCQWMIDGGFKGCAAHSGILLGLCREPPSGELSAPLSAAVHDGAV